MDNFIAARSQMGMSLAFHIIFATIGVSLPLMRFSTVAGERGAADAERDQLVVI
jgi:catalase